MNCDITPVIHLDNDLLKDKFSKEDYEFCIETLKEEFKLNTNDKNEVIQITPSKQSLILLEEFLKKLSSNLDKNEIKVLLIKQIFHSLRNSLSNTEVQNAIINTNILNYSHEILKFVLPQNTVLITDCLKMQLQFLSNLIVKNEVAQKIVWDMFSEQILLSLNIKQVAYITLLILYNIWSNYKDLIPKNVKIITRILELSSENIDNVYLVIELFICENIMSSFYDDLNCNLRVILLQNIYSMLVDDVIEIPHIFIEILVSNFKIKSDCILKTVTDYLKNIEPLEVAILLNCIASASGKETILPKLQSDKSLLINCAFLLKSIHEAGKGDANNFSSIQKLSEINHPNDSIQEHPGFGFKAALIRVIGNLCWKHKENQDLIREVDCLPLLMDCCNIDARNPLIIQWVILAIRNLCENNFENQEIIAQLTKIGVVDSSIIREMGLTLHDDGDKNIGIVPLK